jgi:hypothetical protein
VNRSLLAVTLLWGFQAAAQCRADNDCKGERICVGGACVDPPQRQTPAAETPPPPPPPPPAYAAPPAVGPEESGASAVREIPGWALGGAIWSFVAAGAVAGLAAGSAVTAGNFVPSISMGATATVIFGLTLPLVALSSSSVRNGARVEGSLGLRIAGWVLYGLTMVNAVVAIVLGIVAEVPWPVIAVLGVLGVTGLTLVGVEALLARSQAAELVERNTRGSSRSTVRVAPWFAAAPVRGGATIVAGVGVTF